MKTFYSLVAMAALGSAFTLHAAPATQAPSSKTFTAAVPATGIDTLSLHFNVGEATIRTGSDNIIHVRVHAKNESHSFHFIFTWTTGDGEVETLPPNLKLIQQRSGDSLSLCLGINECGDSDDSDEDWKGEWTITVPARMHVDLEGNVGKGTVAAVAGGVDIDLNVGKLELRLPCGPIRGSVNVGKIEAKVAAPAYGKVDLSVNVGEIDFSVNDDDIQQGYNRNIMSVSQSLQGSGHIPYKLAVNTGGINLALGVDGIESNPLCKNTTHTTHAPGTSTSP